jgi:ATP-dependent Lhr-like helicase
MKKMTLSGETVTISAADPLNLVGILVPGERVPAISGRTVTFADGVAALATEPVLQSATGS